MFRGYEARRTRTGTHSPVGQRRTASASAVRMRVDALHQKRAMTDTDALAAKVQCDYACRSRSGLRRSGLRVSVQRTL